MDSPSTPNTIPAPNSHEKVMLLPPLTSSCEYFDFSLSESDFNHLFPKDNEPKPLSKDPNTKSKSVLKQKAKESVKTTIKKKRPRTATKRSARDIKTNTESDIANRPAIENAMDKTNPFLSPDKNNTTKTEVIPNNPSDDRKLKENGERNKKVVGLSQENSGKEVYPDKIQLPLSAKFKTKAVIIRHPNRENRETRSDFRSSLSRTCRTFIKDTSANKSCRTLIESKNEPSEDVSNILNDINHTDQNFPTRKEYKPEIINNLHAQELKIRQRSEIPCRQETSRYLRNTSTTNEEEPKQVTSRLLQLPVVAKNCFGIFNEIKKQNQKEDKENLLENSKQTNFGFEKKAPIELEVFQFQDSLKTKLERVVFQRKNSPSCEDKKLPFGTTIKRGSVFNVSNLLSKKFQVKVMHFNNPKQ